MKHDCFKPWSFYNSWVPKITWNNSKNELQPVSRLDSSSHSPRLRDRRVRFHNADHWPRRHVAHGEKCQLIDPSIHTVKFIENRQSDETNLQRNQPQSDGKKKTIVFFLKSLDKNPSLLHFWRKKNEMDSIRTKFRFTKSSKCKRATHGFQETQN